MTDAMFWQCCFEEGQKLGYDEQQSRALADAAAGGPQTPPDRYAKPEREYGPRHHPPTRTASAVERLKALCEDSEMDDEALQDAITGIAKEFDAAGLKEVAEEFGIEGGLGTKASCCQRIADKVSRARRRKS